MHAQISLQKTVHLTNVTSDCLEILCSALVIEERVGQIKKLFCDCVKVTFDKNKEVIYVYPSGSDPDKELSEMAAYFIDQEKDLWQDEGGEG